MHPVARTIKAFILKPSFATTVGNDGFILTALI
jgi:hypothetical protein